MVAVVQLVRASDCGSECRGFESHLPPGRKEEIRLRVSSFSLYISVLHTLKKPKKRAHIAARSFLYGELAYHMQYKGIKGDPFPWLYIDFDTLAETAEAHGFKAELITMGAITFLYILHHNWSEWRH